MRRSASLLVFLTLALVIHTGTVQAGKAITIKGAAPPAEILLEYDFSGKLIWFYQNDVGLMLLYGDGKLHRIDLLAERPERMPAIDVPDLSAEGSVVPIARTGLLLVPRALSQPAMRDDHRSFSIDTLSGRTVWENAPLPVPDAVLSYPDADMAVFKSADDGGHVFALDLRNGKKVWDIARPAAFIWAEGQYIRVVSEGELLSVDLFTGEIARTAQLSIPKGTHLYAPRGEDVLVLRKGKHLEGYSIPPAPPAPAAPVELLWKHETAGHMLKPCINFGACGINKLADDLLLVRSAWNVELIRLSDGKNVFHIKQAAMPEQVSWSPDDRWLVAAIGERLRVYDAETFEMVHDYEYPKGDEGKKALKGISWIDGDTIMIIYPDKKGNPRKLNAFSCLDGSFQWSFVLPDVADFALTAEQRAKLVKRITLSLGLTMVSASNPMSIGGVGFYAIFVPNLNVAQTLNATAVFNRGGSEEEGGGSTFTRATERFDRCEGIRSSASRVIHFVIGDRGNYEVLLIDLQTGHVSKEVSFVADKVHGISPLTPFDYAVTFENNHRKLRLISLSGR